uniref:Uncharacterized protein n=1 Tax=Glossina austeni TaxID=7395 RepID=A0A1A9VDN8_GLOAU
MERIIGNLDAKIIHYKAIHIEVNLRNISDSELVTRTPLMENYKDIVLVDRSANELQKGRHKSHKSSHRYKKLHKFVMPLLMGVLAAKLILIPVLLKVLTAISTSALVLSKIALVATGFLALKWFFSGSVKDTRRFDLIYLPQSEAAPFRIHGGSFTLADDQAWDASEVVDLQPYKKTQHKYIPMIVKPGTKYSSYGSGVGTKDSYAQTTYYDETNLYKDLKTQTERLTKYVLCLAEIADYACRTLDINFVKVFALDFKGK